MPTFEPGDRVRIDIPDETDPDFQYHREHGEVVEVLHDEASAATGDARDAILYRVELSAGKVLDFRWRDLRPAAEDA